MVHINDKFNCLHPQYCIKHKFRFDYEEMNIWYYYSQTLIFLLRIYPLLYISLTKSKKNPQPQT